MDSNNTASTTISSNATFHCPHTQISWDLNASTFDWLIVAIELTASLPTILLNAIVILVKKKSKELQKTSNTLLSSLAVTDLLIGLIVMPLSATVDFLISSQTSFAHTCMLESVNVFFMYLLFFATLFHLTIIAWERYVAIQKWMDYKVIVTNGRVKNLAIAAWLSGLFAAVPTIIMSVVGVDQRIVEGWYIIWAFMGTACLILVAFFYRKVYLGIRKRKVTDISQVTVLVKVKLESNVAKTTGLLTAAMMFTYIPIFGLGILASIFLVFRTRTSIRFTVAVTELNSLFNPLLYWYRDRRFRNGLRELLPKWEKPQALQPAVDTARCFKRKDPFTSAEQHNTEIPSRRLKRSASYNPSEVLDSIQGRPREVVLKRSLSAPLLDKCSSSFDGLDLQHPPYVMTITAIIHARRKVQRKARENNSVSIKDVNRPQVIPNTSRSIINPSMLMTP